MREVKLSVLGGILMVVGLTAARDGPALGKPPLPYSQGERRPRRKRCEKQDRLSRWEQYPVNSGENVAAVAAGKTIFEQRCAICH